ncbi:MAG: hypothetical protein WC728_18500 [Elusimicrobiota bacterium]
MDDAVEGLKELQFFATLMCERIVEPYNYPYQQTTNTIMVVDGAAPLVGQLNELEWFKKSLLAALREALSHPASPKWRDLPYVSLRLEAKDEHGHDLHWLILTIKPEVDQKGYWLATHATDQREEKSSVRIDINDLLHLAKVLLCVTPNQWASEVAFDNPVPSPKHDGPKARARRHRG